MTQCYIIKRSQLQNQTLGNATVCVTCITMPGSFSRRSLNSTQNSLKVRRRQFLKHRGHGGDQNIGLGSIKWRSGFSEERATDLFMTAANRKAVSGSVSRSCTPRWANWRWRTIFGGRVWAGYEFITYVLLSPSCCIAQKRDCRFGFIIRFSA